MHSYVRNICMMTKSYLCLLLLVREFLSTMFDFHAILPKMQIQISASDNYYSGSSNSGGGSSSGSSSSDDSGGSGSGGSRVVVVMVVV